MNNKLGESKAQPQFSVWVLSISIYVRVCIGETSVGELLNAADREEAPHTISNVSYW
jgi:hypothetical protein